MTGAEVIAAGKAVIEVSKILLDLVNRSKLDADAIRQKVSEMLIHLTSMQTLSAELQNENRDLQQQLDSKKARTELEADVEFKTDGGFYIRKSEREKSVDIAYCPVCWSKDDKLIPMADEDIWYKCHVHKFRLQTQALKAKERRMNQQSNAYEGGPDSWMGD